MRISIVDRTDANVFARDCLESVPLIHRSPAKNAGGSTIGTVSQICIDRWMNQGGNALFALVSRVKFIPIVN